VLKDEDKRKMEEALTDLSMHGISTAAGYTGGAVSGGEQSAAAVAAVRAALNRVSPDTVPACIAAIRDALTPIHPSYPSNSSVSGSGCGCCGERGWVASGTQGRARSRFPPRLRAAHRVRQNPSSLSLRCGRAGTLHVFLHSKHLQLMTVITVHVTNQTPGSDNPMRRRRRRWPRCS
jgi:hypothetical protein